MPPVAFVHSQGVVLKRSNRCQFYVLELAYIDVFGNDRKFFIQSPYNYQYALRHFNPGVIRRSLDVMMLTGHTWKRQKIYPYAQVIHFLKKQYRFFKKHFFDPSFAYKGNSFQPKVLKDARIPGFNLEQVGCPKLSDLNEVSNIDVCIFHPTAGQTTTTSGCAYHKAAKLAQWYKENVCTQSETDTLNLQLAQLGLD